MTRPVEENGSIKRNPGKMMKFLRVASAVLAIHLVLLAFFFFKPTVRYFTSTCVSTVLVWSGVFAIERWRKGTITAGFILQLAVQRFAYTSWLSEQAEIWWPLAQFVALQYLVVLSLSRPSED